MYITLVGENRQGDIINVGGVNYTVSTTGTISVPTEFAAALLNAGWQEPIPQSMVTGLSTALAGKQDIPANASSLAKITESLGSPLWNGGAWPGGSGGASYTEAANFAALPTASTVSGKTYAVLAGQGVYLINRKPAGFYRSDGSAWQYLADLADPYFLSSTLSFNDSTDTSKALHFNVSGITHATVVTASWPDKSGTVAYTSDLTGLQATITTGTTGQYLRGDLSLGTMGAAAVGLSAVENTALSIWVGSSNLVTVGTIGTGTWHGAAIGDSYISSAATWNGKQAAYTNLSTIGGLADASGWLKNSGTGTFSYSTPTKSDVGLSAVENTALSTWTGSTSLVTVGTIGTGVWKGSAIGDLYISSAATWSGKQNAITTGTTAQYLKGDLSLGTMGAAAVGLGNVENTALSTWTGSTSITTVGTIGTGVWNGTAIADNKIASASTWNAKQAAYTALTTLGALADAAGVLTSNGSGVYSWGAGGGGTYDNWGQTERTLSKDRSISVSMSVFIAGPFDSNGHTLTIEAGSILVII